MSTDIMSLARNVTPLSATNGGTFFENFENFANTQYLGGFYTGTETPPTPDIPDRPTSSERKDLKNWEMQKLKASGLLYMCIDITQRAHISGNPYRNNPHLAYQKLLGVHRQKKPAHRFAATDALLSVQMEENETLVDVAARATQRMLDLQALRPASSEFEESLPDSPVTPIDPSDPTTIPLPGSSSASIAGDIMSALSPKRTTYGLAEMDNELLAMTMLRAPGPEYANFISSLMLLGDLSPDTIRSKFQNEDTNRKSQAARAASAAPATAPKWSPSARSSTSSSSSSTTPGSSSSAVTCWWCHAEGHIESECNKKKRAMKNARAKTAANSAIREETATKELRPT